MTSRFAEKYRGECRKGVESGGLIAVVRMTAFSAKPSSGSAPFGAIWVSSAPKRYGAGESLRTNVPGLTSSERRRLRSVRRVSKLRNRRTVTVAVARPSR